MAGNRRLLLVAVPLLLGLAACGGPDQSASADTASHPPATPTDTALPVTDDPTPVDAGTYLMPQDAWAVADYSVTIPDGWSLQYGHIFAKNADQEGELGFYGVVVDEVYDDACHGEGVPVPVGPGTEALVSALQKQRGPRVSPPVQTTFGGHPATRVDLRIPEGMTPNCRMMGENLQVWFSRPAPKYLVLLPGTVTNVYILDLDGERQVFVVMRPEDLPAAERADLQAALDSIRIGG